jgi:hypothetical protein
MIEQTAQHPWGRYHRQVEGADFSLEANTELAPEADHFYLLRCGEVLLCSADFSTAEAAYKALCHEFWVGRLRSEDRAVRVAGAWGLLGQDLQHRHAAEVIRDDGTPGDQKRMEMLRRKKQFEVKRAARAGAAARARGV